MAAVPAPGQAYEVEAAAPLLDTLKNVMVVGDKGFDSDTLSQHLLAQGCLASIPPKSGRLLLLGITGAFTDSGTRSKTSFSGSKSISAYPPVMKSSPSLSSTLSS